MSASTFPCARCGRNISIGVDEGGTLVQCPSCRSHGVAPVSLTSVPQWPGASAPPFQDRRIGQRRTPLWVYSGSALGGCALALGLILFFIQGSRDQSAFAEAMQAAENAETPAQGVRLVEELLCRRLGPAQAMQARMLEQLLRKRIEVEAAAVAVARREEAARQAAALAAAAATPPPAPLPVLPPPLTLADAQTAYEQAVRLASGDGVARDETAAMALLYKAAEIGLAAAQHDLAAMYAVGTGCATNSPAAVLWCRKAAEQGDADAQAWLGYAFAGGIGKDVPADPAQAATWNEKAATQGVAVAALNLGIQYLHGLGVPPDPARAFRLIAEAAARGNAEAQFNLGALYARGLGVASDPTNAFRCFQQAHAQGSAAGTFALGLLYGNGIGVAKDRQMAAACYLAAARSGHVGAQKQIGRLYLMGYGVPWSEQDAIAWYRAAASQGDAYARQAVQAYHNTHLPPVYAQCEACLGKGTVVRACPECRGAGNIPQTASANSVKTCVCGWQMVNGRCPNCGRTAGAVRTFTVPCAACRGTGRLSLACRRCSGLGKVVVSGAAQATFAQLVNRPDPGSALAPSASAVPVPLLPFRAGVGRGGGI